MDTGERQLKMDKIYENTDAIRNQFTMETEDTNTLTIQPGQLTGSVKRSSRTAIVCLVLLCFLLLTAVIMLGAFIYINTTNYAEERRQLLSNITNLTEEGAQLLTNFKEERDKLLINSIKLTNEKVQLVTKITNLTEERVQQLNNFTSVKEERDLLLTNINNLTKERDQLLTKITNMTEENIQLLNELLKCLDGWIYYHSSLYYFSNETKNWSESRRYCKEREADLIIINSIKEQHAVQELFGLDYYSVFWIGLTITDEEGKWEWVDGTTPSNWLPEEYYSKWEYKDCAVATSSDWIAAPCYYAFEWICEKSIASAILSRALFNHSINNYGEI